MDISIVDEKGIHFVQLGPQTYQLEFGNGSASATLWTKDSQLTDIYNLKFPLRVEVSK